MGAGLASATPASGSVGMRPVLVLFEAEPLRGWERRGRYSMTKAHLTPTGAVTINGGRSWDVAGGETALTM
jgi:hypothetical protein